MSGPFNSLRGLESDEEVIDWIVARGALSMAESGDVVNCDFRPSLPVGAGGEDGPTEDLLAYSLYWNPNGEMRDTLLIHKKRVFKPYSNICICFADIDLEDNGVGGLDEDHEGQ